MSRDRGSIHPALGVTLAILGLVVLIAGGFALKVALAGPVGRGNAHITKESSTNRIGQNSVFYDLKTDYDATVNKISVMKGAAATGDTTSVINLQGLRAHCLDVVGQYEAQSGKYISRDFKDAGLPDALDAAACKE